jgi:hypothetical protein
MMYKAFTTVSAKLEQLKEAESDLSGSDAEEEASHFQCDDAFQFTQLESKFEPMILKLFKQSHGIKITLSLKQVILLDSQSTMDLFCKKALVDKTYKSSHCMQVKTNAGTMLVSQKTTTWLQQESLVQYKSHYKHSCAEQLDSAVPCHLG